MADGAVVVRGARPDELRVAVAITLAAYGELWPDGLGYYADVIRTMPEAVAAGDPLQVLIAERDAAIIGSIAYVPDASSAWAEWSDPDAAGIRLLAVDPARQGAGAGRALVEACRQRAIDGGRRRIRLHTAPEMRAAQALYERVGFVRDESGDYSDPADDMCILAYVLELA